MTARIMDEATRKKLAGLLPFAPGAYTTDTLEVFEGVEPEYRPRFFLRDLPPGHWSLLRTALKAGRVVDAPMMLEALNAGALAGWENLLNSGFEEIPYSKEAVKALPFLWIEALYWKCASLCSPSKAEKEGLDS